MARSNRRTQTLMQLNPPAFVTEAYKTIRTNIQFAAVAGKTQIILITSSEPGEGKTYTAANLATVSAQAGNSVLLIDGDMRKPQVHQRFQVSNLVGLSTVMIKEESLESCLMDTHVPNLSVLPSGPIPPNPSELLASQSFAELLEECQRYFDLIYIDSPPILAVTDALVLGRITDGTIMVVDAQHTNRNAAIKAVSMLNQVNTRFLGVVLNRIERKSGTAYYYYYQQSVPVRA